MYLSDIIPRRQYRLSVVIAFIQNLIKGACVEQAYLDAIGCASKDARHAWRWLQDLFKQLPRWRTSIAKPVETFVAPQPSRRLKILLPTLERLLNSKTLPTIDAIQRHLQHAFF